MMKDMNVFGLSSIKPVDSFSDQKSDSKDASDVLNIISPAKTKIEPKTEIEPEPVKPKQESFSSAVDDINANIADDLDDVFDSIHVLPEPTVVVPEPTVKAMAVNKPTIKPVEKQEEPKMEPVQPIEKSVQPAEKPVEEPVQPIEKPVQPAEKLVEEPVEQAENPVKEPVQPAEHQVKKVTINRKDKSEDGIAYTDDESAAFDRKQTWDEGIKTTQARVATPDLTSVLKEKAQNAMLVKKFEKGEYFKSGNFIYSICDGDVMVMEYIGTSSEVVMQDIVNGRKILFVNPKTFVANASTGAVSRFRDRFLFGVKKDVCQTVTSLKLPARLVKIPSGFLHEGCNLAKLIIPASVSTIDPTAFSKCKIGYIYFLGSCPAGLADAVIPKSTTLYALKINEASYAGIPGITFVTPKKK